MRTFGLARVWRALRHQLTQERMFKKTVEGLAAWFSLSDEEAMERARSEADLHAFGLLVQRWRKRIYNLCLRMTGSTHTADDLTQELFVRIFDRRRGFDPSQKFSTWLWRVALNLCYDEIRRTQRRRECPLEDQTVDGDCVRLEVIDGSDPQVRAQEQEEAELVRRALLQLPEIYRTVLVLRHYENLKLREIADVLQIPQGTVNSRMAEGLAQLTRLLEPRFATRPVPASTTRPAYRSQEILAL
jgi:RNA polymerase sigma-70 factor (ECF subfamily)